MDTDGHGSDEADAVPPTRARPRVGFWLGLLLLVVPIFYPLLYLRPYSWVARVGWGLWLGLIVYAKLAGFSEPVINLPRIEEELREQERTGIEPHRTARATFIQPDEAPPTAPPLEAYLRELGGGVLGRRIQSHRVQGDALHIAFQPVDFYLDGEDAVALESVGAALSLFYGRDFRALELDFVLQGRPLRVALTRAGFERFFAMSEEEIRAVLADRAAQEASIFRAENMPVELRRAFFERFAEYR